MPNPKNPYYLRGPREEEEEDALSVYQEDVLENLLADNNQDLPEMAMKLQLETFSGKPGERGEVWWRYFERYAAYNNVSENRQTLLLPFHFRDHARIWYDALPQETRDNLARVKAAFLRRFDDNDGVNGLNTYNLQQAPGESCIDYFSRAQQAVSGRDCPESMQVRFVINGLLDRFKNTVILRTPTTLEEVRQAMWLAEVTCPAQVNTVEQSDPGLTTAINNMTREMGRLFASVSTIQQKQQQHTPPQPEPSSQMPYWDADPDAHFRPLNRRPSMPPQTYARRTHQRHIQRGYQQQQSQQQQSTLCYRCNGKNCNSQNCPALYSICKFCHKQGHWATACRGAKRHQQGAPQ